MSHKEYMDYWREYWKNIHSDSLHINANKDNMKGKTLEEMIVDDTGKTTRSLQTGGHMPLLIDGDIIAYRCSAAADGRVYKIGAEKFKYKKEAVAYCDAHSVHISNIKKEMIAEPVSHALHNVDKMMATIESAYDDDFVVESEVFLSGNTNFRTDIFTEYKANRDKKSRPTHLEACKQHLVNKYGGVPSLGCEADDAISIRAHELFKDGKPYVIVSLDKDLDMIPGEHYNWVKDIKYQSNPYEGLLIFYRQVLTGDNVDNIPGLWKVGKKTAEKILPTPAKGSMWWTSSEMYTAVISEYIRRLGKDDKETDKEYLTRVISTVTRNARLLWLQTYEGELWSAPKLDKGKLIEKHIKKLADQEKLEKKLAKDQKKATIDSIQITNYGNSTASQMVEMQRKASQELAQQIDTDILKNTKMVESRRLSNIQVDITTNQMEVLRAKTIQHLVQTMEMQGDSRGNIEKFINKIMR